jgi:uncharacterized protein YhaN
MRIQQLSLLRYGKFTDRLLSFPKAPRDFHFVVGANEAGKSTTRSAILDLLYGIETRSTLDFRHPKAEMRLGAAVEHQGTTLNFVRTKARIKSLFDPAGNVLPEAALSNLLAGSDRAFFDQMFGLDHARLVAGGNDILDASNDVGQILFQSAAGIGSLGMVRDQLEAEANKLWARRRSGDRAYYIASDELARAEAALKAATVRTKDWMEASSRVQDLEERREAARVRHRSLEGDRLRLERVRRVTPALRQLRECRAELHDLADVVLLPPDASRQLNDTELELAGAQRDSQFYASQAKAARARLAEIRLDEHLLKHEADVRALADRRQQVRNHERDIDRRRLEVAAQWQQVEGLMHQLGWPAVTEETLIERLPPVPARAALADLARRSPVLEQSRQTASVALAEKEADHAALEVQLSALTVKSVPPELRVVLSAARGLGDLNVAARRDEALASKNQRGLALAVAGLGRWAPDLATLRSLVLPSTKEIAPRVKQFEEAKIVRNALTDRRTDIQSSIAAQVLEIAQYRNAHQPVSLAELASARSERDAVWRIIKSGEQPAQLLASDFEFKVTTADNVADRRHDKAREVSELQSRLDALERLKQQAADNADRLAACEVELAVMDAEWAQMTEALGFAGLPRQEFESWRATRDRVLIAEDAVTEAHEALNAGHQSAEATTAALRAALTGAGVAFDPATAFETLVLIASDAVDLATEAKARLDELTKQRKSAAAALSRQRDKSTTVQAEFDAWTDAWRIATTQTRLAETTGVAAAEGALAVMAEIDERLKGIRDIRQARIETMQHDLRDFGQDVGLLVNGVAPDLAALEHGAAVSELTSRLAKALEDKKEADRLRKELETSETQAVSADNRVGRAKATLLPLMNLAQAGSHDDLRASIARSDRRRLVEVAATIAARAVEEGGDGLGLHALDAEIAAVDAAEVPVLMADVAQQQEVVRQQQDGLTTELTHANAALASIAGQDDAARAESERQDALAKMANAAERYVKVYTASRLLKWSIDRYRETRQGPMLMRAGDIFGGLTLGSFQKLVLDFDSEPLTLHGLRPNGELVGIAGMSDGTRDQLYLALRLAALELHLDQGHALPFIADDLFITYDDQRAKAGLEALGRLSEKTQVIFLCHHDHLVPTVREVFGPQVDVVGL